MIHVWSFHFSSKIKNFILVECTKKCNGQSILYICWLIEFLFFSIKIITHIYAMDNLLIVNTKKKFRVIRQIRTPRKDWSPNFTTLKLSQKGRQQCSLKRSLVNVLPELGSIPRLLRLKFVEKRKYFCANILYHVMNIFHLLVLKNKM